MVPKIVLTITNPNNKDYPCIVLRKFFNMVFIEPDGKSLSIYTATVFGGADCGSDEDSIPNPKCAQHVQCALRFDYTVESQAGSSNKTIQIENLTDSFFQQTTWVSKIWGSINVCKTQSEIENLLVERYSNIYSSTSDIEVPDVAHTTHFLTIEEVHKGRESHFCIVSSGQFETFAPNAYQLTTSNQVAGIEAMNWVKTTITFKNDVFRVSDKLNFEVMFSEGCKFYTPDFTWYFAPPTNYEVDVETATLAIGQGEAHKNRISRVADTTTVEFKEWVVHENIKDRKKVRINIREDIAGNNYALSGQSINVNLSLINPERHGNTQFILGLIVAFLLSFCSDKTRLNDYMTCLFDFCEARQAETGTCVSWFSQVQGCGCSSICTLLGVIFPILIILAFIAISFSRKRCFPSSNSIAQYALIGARGFGIAATILLVIYVYILWLGFPKMMAGIVKNCLTNQIILLSLVATSFIGNFSYAFYCGKVKKNRIVDFM